MSEDEKQKEIKTDWSINDLKETERNNLLGFFALLLKVDKRVNPKLYAGHSHPNDTQGLL